MSGSSSLSPEYVSAYSGKQLIAVAVAFVPIILIFVSLRFYSRHLSGTKWGLDDYLILASVILQIGDSAATICTKRSLLLASGLPQDPKD